MDVRAYGVRTEVDEGRGGRARRRQQGIVFVHQALGDTLKHIHSFTHTDTAVHTHRRMLLPTATPDLCWHLRGQPHLQSRPGCQSCSSSEGRASPPALQPHQGSEKSLEVLRTVAHSWRLTYASRGAAACGPTGAPRVPSQGKFSF